VRWTITMWTVVLMCLSPVLADRPDGCDVSHWNGDITVSEWQQAYSAGKVFVFAKATQGTWYTDTEFYDNMTRAPQAGLLTGCYHFAEPQYTSATAEADYFVSVAGPYLTDGYLRPALDLEWGGPELGKTALSNWVNAWMDRVEALTGIEPIIYCNTNYAINYLNSTVADRDLWIANWYPNDPETEQPNIGVFNSWAFWQWTDSCSIPGIGTSEDCDVFNGTMADLNTFVIGNGGPSEPPFIVESRSGGQNYANYSETGTWSDGSSQSTAPGCTSGIGHRWCTLDGNAKTAVFRFTPDKDGTYEIFTTNCTTWNSGNPMIHHVTHADGTTDVGVCQNADCDPTAANLWYSLGQYVLHAGIEYTVTLDGDTDSGSGPSGNAGRSDAVKWQWLSSITGPEITQQPVDQAVCAGQTAHFTVTATGQGSLSYQWQKNGTNLTDGGHYSGTATDTLTILNVGSSDVADYRCVVTDDVGSTISDAAALTLKPETVITSHPSDQSVPEGNTAQFTVSATGANLTYQWYKGSTALTNGGDISGATAPTLVIAHCDPSDEGSYHCVVTGDCGAVSSNSATLTVTPPLIPGDHDGDRDVDVEDFGHLQLCLGTLDVQNTWPDCVDADLNGDNNVDETDRSLFVGCMTGPTVEGDPNCAP